VPDVECIGQANIEDNSMRTDINDASWTLASGLASAKLKNFKPPFPVGRTFSGHYVRH
jgi:hypothetical protein